MKTASLGLTGFLTTTALRRAPQAPHEQIKRVFDLLGAITGLLLFGPLMLALGLIVRLTSRGQAFYVQERLGKGGKPFNIVKLRTMRTDAEAAGAQWSKTNDPRVTSFGRFLRKTHLDELPQLINVLRGDMSLIGPRPERACFVKKLKGAVPLYMTRLAVKPGITGLAQVKHHYDRTIEDVQTKLGYDLEYIKRACLLLDLQIIAMTAVKVVLGRGGSS